MIVRTLSVVLIASLVGTAAPPQDSFKLAPPVEVAHDLWATFYHVHLAAASTVTDAIPLTGADGPLGVSLSKNDWCDAALEGTVTVSGLAEGTATFNVGGMAETPFTDCTYRFPKLKPEVLARMARLQFVKLPDDARYGLGARPNLRLVPYRSVAADKTVYPLGTVLYIPGLRGVTFTGPDGVARKHDGYVMVVDTGGAIRGNHIDFFTGTSSINPAPKLFLSKEKPTFQAYVTKDPAALALLTALHSRTP